MYIDFNSSKTYTWFCDGYRCWLHKVPNIEDELEHEREGETEVYREVIGQLLNESYKTNKILNCSYEPPTHLFTYG